MPTNPAPAPDFDDHPYPSAGAKIGPAWRAAWSALHATAELDGWELSDRMRAAAPGLTERSALELLDDACRAGWLHRQRARSGDSRARSTYRLTYAARRLSAAAGASGHASHAVGPESGSCAVSGPGIGPLSATGHPLDRAYGA